MKPRKLAVLVASIAVLGGCAATADPTVAAAQSQGRQCFHADTVNSFTSLGDDAVMVRAGAGDFYRLELFGPCLNVDWAMQIGIRARGSPWICEGYDAELIVPGPVGGQRCAVQSVRKLTEAEVEVFRRG